MSSPDDQSAGCLRRSLNWVVKRWPYVLGLIVLIVIIIIITLLFTVFQVTPRMIGGQDAPLGKYPFIASLRILGTHYCSGSILNKRWILTAAHCVAGPDIKHARYLAGKVSMTVRVGMNQLEINDGQEYDVKDLVPHDNYTSNDRSTINDIGLVSVTKNIEFNDRVKPITLPKHDFNKIKYPVTVIGWGYTKNGGSNRRLQELKLLSIKQDVCVEFWAMMSVDINESHICAAYRSMEFGIGVCKEDAGGPLVADGVQIGVVSFGLKLCRSSGISGYARVYMYLDWIKERSKISS